MRWSSNKFSKPIFQEIYGKETILENFGAHRVKWTFLPRWGRLYPGNTQHGHCLRDLQRKPALLGIVQGRLLVFLQVNMGVWNETLQNNTIKYTIREHRINNKCKHRRRLLFSLEIINVTYKDDGKYFCQMSCDSEKKSSSLVWLHMVAQPIKGTVEVSKATTSQIRKKWS